MPSIRQLKTLCLFACVSLVLFGCQRSSEPDKWKLELQGYVEGELSYMASPFSGALINLAKQRGDSIKQNDLMFTLDPEPQRMQTLAAEAEVLQAESRLALANLRLTRTQKLYEQKAIDKDALDAAVDTRNEAQDGLANAQQKSKEADWNLSEKTSTAPVNGMIYDTYFRKGEWVTSGMPVLSILAPENINILFFIPEKMIRTIKIQDRVHIIVQNKTYDARIVYISPEVEYTPPVIFSRENDAVLVFRVRAKPALAQAYAFHPGQPVRVRFVR